MFVCDHLCITVLQSLSPLICSDTSSLSLSECRSVTALFVLLESLQNGVPSKGPFVCRFDYERAISPPGADGAHPQVTAGVCGCIFVCVCVSESEIMGL